MFTYLLDYEEILKAHLGMWAQECCRI